MQRHTRLDLLFDVMTGAKPYQVGKGTPPQTKDIVQNKPFTGYEKKDDTWVPYIRGRVIDRYTNMWTEQKGYIKYGIWLAEPRSSEVFQRAKLFIRQTGDSLVATYDEGNVSNNTLHSIYPLESNHDISLYYLLGILNSTLMNWYYRIVNYLEVGKPMAEVKGIYIKKLPIVSDNPVQAVEIETHSKTLLNLCQQRFYVKQIFLNYILKRYEPKKISEQIERFDVLSFKDFIAELQKQKVKLTASQQMELLSFYEEKQKKIAEMSAQIFEVQHLLDDLVFKIYHIPADVAEMIRENTSVVL